MGANSSTVSWKNKDAQQVKQEWQSYLLDTQLKEGARTKREETTSLAGLWTSLSEEDKVQLLQSWIKVDWHHDISQSTHKTKNQSLDLEVETKESAPCSYYQIYRCTVRVDGNGQLCKYLETHIDVP